jgi:hypothetical protein
MNDIAVASILGGPLHQAGRRLGLVRGDSNTVLLGFAIGLSLWLIMMAASLVDGVASRVLTLAWSGAHARLLVVIPLFFLTESWLDPQIGRWVRSLSQEAGAAESSRAALASLVTRVNQHADRWLPEAVALVAAVLINVYGGQLQPYGVTTAYDASRAEFQGTWNSTLYWATVPVVFRFLLFRWVWRLGLWWWFLARLARLPLRLHAGHPDRAGGLGGVELVQTRLVLLVAALSVLEATSYAEELTRHEVAVRDLYPSVAVVLLVDLVFMVGPVLVFTPRLWACRVSGLERYRALASRYVEAFERKWTSGAPEHEPLIGTPDVQSLADMGGAFDTVRDMRAVPVGWWFMLQIGVAALLPLAPLLLFQYPLAEIVQSLLMRVAGL